MYPHRPNSKGVTQTVVIVDLMQETAYERPIRLGMDSIVEGLYSDNNYLRWTCQDFLGYSLPPQDHATIELIAANKARRDAYLRAQARKHEEQRKKRHQDARQHGKQIRPYKKRRR